MGARPSDEGTHRVSGSVWIIALAAALGAGLATAAPTGLVAADFVWKAGLAAVVTLSAATAARWTWIVAAGIAAVAAIGGDIAVIAVAVLALLLALFGALRPERAASLGALVLALATQALLRLPSVGFSGSTAIVAGAAIAPVLVSAYVNADPPARRRVRRGLVLAGVVGVVALVPVGFTAVVTAREATTAVDESQAWLEAARGGEQAAAISHLDVSHASFEQVEESTGASWLWPARVLPVIGAQLDAVHRIASSGTDITESAGRAARIATPENLRLEQGQIDVALLRELREPLADAAAALNESRERLAEIDTTWLVPPLQSRVVEFEEQVVDATDDTDLAVAALDVAPELLGADGARTYLVLFASPAEARELGGFVGNAAIVTADNGHVELEQVLRSRELNDATTNLSAGRLEEIRGHGFPSRYLDYEPWRNWQNITGTPDFPTVSDMVRELAPDAIGRPVDGVLYVDPEGLAGLLQLTGPIEVEGLDELIGPDNVTDFLLREQYVLYPETAERADFLEDVARSTFELLTTSSLPGPRLIGAALGPAVDEGHLRIWTFDPEEQALFERLGVTGELDRSRAGDDVLVTTANANPNKIDAYLHRTVAYDADLDTDTGAVEATVTIDLANDAPLDLSDYVIGNANGEPQGSNRTLLSLYTGLGVRGATIDGRPLPFETHDEYGLRRAAAFVTVPPGGHVQLVFTLGGELALDAGGHGFTVRVRTPAVVFPDAITTRLDAVGARVKTPEIVGAVQKSPVPALAAGSAEFDLTGLAIVRFPLE